MLISAKMTRVDRSPRSDPDKRPHPHSVADDSEERLRAAAAIKAVLALPSWPTSMDRTRHLALTTALTRLEAGDDLADALAAVQDLLPSFEPDP